MTHTLPNLKHLVHLFHRKIAMLGAGCLLMLALAGCGSSAPPQKAEAPKGEAGPVQLNLTPLQAKSIGLQLGPAQIISLKEQVVVNGEIQAIHDRQAHVYTLAPGRVLSVPVQTR